MMVVINHYFFNPKTVACVCTLFIFSNIIRNSSVFVLFCFVLFCFVLFCFVLFCFVLFFAFYFFFFFFFPASFLP